jgi:hypothetical protein
MEHNNAVFILFIWTLLVQTVVVYKWFQRDGDSYALCGYVLQAGTGTK